MNFNEDDEINIKNNTLKKAIIISIVILTFLGILIVGLIIYKINNPTTIIAYIDNNRVKNFTDILDIQEDENGKTQIYISIRDFATCLKSAKPEIEYLTYKGDYNPKTEDEDKCYIIRDDYEVAMFTRKSKSIYKLNLQKSSGESSDYEQVIIDKDVFLSNGKLYASIDGIEEGYNVNISFDEKKKIIRIYTLEYLTQYFQTQLEKIKIKDYGKLTIEQDNFQNCKSVFENLLVVKSENDKSGIIKADNFSTLILEPQYDDIEYLSDSKTFLVKSGGKKGIFSLDGKRKIDLVYDEIYSMGQDSKLYVVKTNNQFGMVDESGNIIIHPENDKIGIDIKDFLYNDIKNGYFILNSLIPVKRNDKWAFYDKKGKMITDGYIYSQIGCSKIKTGKNSYGLLQLIDYDVVVVGDELGKYWFMESNGNDNLLPHVLEQVYIKTTEGNVNYYMTVNEKDYEVLKYLKQVKQKK